MPAGPVARPWRKLLRLSVRGLIVFVLVVGACLGWVAPEAPDPARRGFWRFRTLGVAAFMTGSGPTERMAQDGIIGRPMARSYCRSRLFR